jgi:hypothetical protein
VRGAEVPGAGALGAGVLGAGALGGGCAGFCEFGRGNGCGVCASAAVADKLTSITAKVRTTELV